MRNYSFFKFRNFSGNTYPIKILLQWKFWNIFKKIKVTKKIKNNTQWILLVLPKIVEIGISGLFQPKYTKIVF